MVKVLITTDTRYPVNRKAVRKAVEKVFVKEKITNLNAEVSVAIVGSRKMKQLTDKYLGDGLVHEVLSFGMEELEGRSGFVKAPDDVVRLGDVVVSWPEVLRLAAAENIYVDEQMSRLVSHGVEHLLGKHHE